MISGRSRFNIYLLLALATASVCGCRTSKNKQGDLLSSLRVHVEATADNPMGSAKAQIYRASPVEISVEKEAFLTEADVAGAQVLDTLGGFDLRIQLNREGTWLLQNYSASNLGKHYAIFSQFGEKGQKARWLAAPIFSRLISDGVLQFTPDASREECAEIVAGLNNRVKKTKSNENW